MAGGPTEIELKLACGAAGLEAIAAHPLLAEAATKSEAQLESIYYDTADARLRLGGVTLRVRSADGADFRQTVKTSGDGLFERGEWERELAGSAPSLEALAETPAAALLGEEPELAAVFTTSVARRAFLVEHDGATVEVALDRGRVRANGGTRHDVSEVELELKDGAPHGVFALARLLGETAELKLGVATKSERGYALAARDPEGPATAEPVHLDHDVTAADAFRAIAHGALRRIRMNEDIVLARPDVEALHQLRVGVRRLRSVFSLYGAVVDEPAFIALKDELKRLSEPFGRARDLDVFLSETMPAEVALRPEAPSLLNLEKRLEARRPVLRRAVLKTLRSKEWRGLLIEIVAWLHSGAWLEATDGEAAVVLRQPARAFAAAELERRLRQVRKRGRALDRISAEERHQVRIAAKKLRYGAEFFESLYESGKQAKRHAAFVKELKKLQGGLGSLNDIATGQALVRDVAAEEESGSSTAFAAGMTAADIEHASEDLLKDARKARKRLLELRPFWR